MIGCSWNFQKGTDMTQGAIKNISCMLRLTSWMLGRFIYFLDPCLFVALWKTGERIFMKSLWNVRHDTRNRLFHTCLYSFTVSHLSIRTCLLATPRSNRWVDFHEIFWIYLLWHKEQSEVFWDDPLTPWTQGSSFYFLGPCLLASRNTRLVDIHEIFRILA